MVRSRLLRLSNGLTALFIALGIGALAIGLACGASQEAESTSTPATATAPTPTSRDPEAVEVERLAALIAPRCSDADYEGVIRGSLAATTLILLEYQKGISLSTFLSVFEEQTFGLHDVDCAFAMTILVALFGNDPSY